MKKRSEREKKAYDTGRVFEVSDMYHKKTKVFHYPNTIYHEHLFESILEKKALKSRVLDIGCADGKSSEKVYKMGAEYVMGVDISERWIKEAKKREIPKKLVFQNKDIHNPITGEFDLIIGRAILHHIDYKKCLSNLYENNLSDGGSMIFMEPLGDNLLIKFFYFYAKEAHTPDEQPFSYKDLQWIEKKFPNVKFYPFNYISLLFGIILCSITTEIENNRIMMVADKIDRWIANNISILKPRFRQFILIIEKTNEKISER